MSELVSLIASNGDFEEANKMHLTKRVPHLGVQVPGAPSAIDILKAMPPPRIMKTHLYYDLLGTGIEKAKPRVIVLQRNPKDCLASFFHMYKNTKGLGDFDACTFSDFFELYKHKHLIFGDQFDHLIGWWENRNKDNFLFISYENMKRNIHTVIREIAAFLNKELPTEMIDAIAEHTSFGNMKKNPMAEIEVGVSDFFRRGIIGDWVNYLDGQQSQLIDEREREVKQKYGIVFQYE